VKKAVAVVGFLPATAITIFASFFLLIQLPKVNEVDALLRQQARMIKDPPPNYNAAAFIPQVLGSFTEAIAIGDARPVIIRNYLRAYNSPLEPYAELIVKKSDEYGLSNYKLPVAIAQQESNLGKKMPPNCHNAWGWGIHSQGTLCFKNWETGIDAYIKGLSEKYGDVLGAQDEDKMLQLLMARYAPVSLEKSNGSWAKGVKQFLDEIGG
jgi:hypothetical protein